MKKFIRLLFKLPATPFVLVFLVLSYIVFNIILFFEWVYEAKEWDKEVTQECIKDIVDRLKRLFTTI